MSLSPRTTKEALAVARAEHANRSQDWSAQCQRFTRFIYGIGPGFGSARAQFLGCDPEDRHVGGHPADAPVGAILHYRGGSSGFGHAMPAAHPFHSGAPAAWSNDLLRTGFIDKVHRSAPVTKWGHVYTGYCRAINDVDLRMPQKQRYAALEKAINRIGAALDTARAQSDAEDVGLLTKEIARLQKMYDEMRRI